MSAPPQDGSEKGEGSAGVMGWWGSRVSSAMAAVGEALGELVDDVEETLDEVMGTKDVQPGAPPVEETPSTPPPSSPPPSSSPPPPPQPLQSPPAPLQSPPPLSSPSPVKTPTATAPEPSVSEVLEELKAYEPSQPSTDTEALFDAAVNDIELQLAVEGELQPRALDALAGTAVYLLTCTAPHLAEELLKAFLERLQSVQRSFSLMLSSPKYSPGGSPAGSPVQHPQLSFDDLTKRAKLLALAVERYCEECKQHRQQQPEDDEGVLVEKPDGE